MPRERPWSGSSLRQLLRDFLNGELETEAFSNYFVSGYNDAVDERALTPLEQPILSNLFDVVGYYSPDPEERLQVPQLTNEEQVWRAALAAQADLDRTD
jgi:hypothetical protein